MPASLTPIGFLNPDVHFNHISPSEARETELSRNLLLVILGATFWDMLVYSLEDIRIIRRSKLHFVIFCFIAARPLAIGFGFVNCIERVLQVNNFYATAISSATVCMLSMVASSYLFLQRVLAVYADRKWVRWSFFALWIAISASDLVIPLGIHPTTVPGTHFYKGADIPSYDSLSVFTLLFFDTAVLLAISYKIALGHGPTPMIGRASWSAFVFGKTLPRFSRAILRGGQQYYLITVGMTIVAGITVTIPSIPAIFKPTVPTAMVCLTASMACRVFRNTKQLDVDVAFTEPGPTHTTIV